MRKRPRIIIIHNIMSERERENERERDLKELNTTGSGCIIKCRTFHTLVLVLSSTLQS